MLGKSLHEARYGWIPRYAYINVFGCIVYYNNPGQKKKLRDQITYSILVGYEKNIIYYIFKPDDRIARGAAVKAIEWLL